MLSIVDSAGVPTGGGPDIVIALLASLHPNAPYAMGLVIAAIIGSVIGSVIGTSLTGMLRTGLVLVGVPSNAFRGAIGALVIVAVVINSLVRREQDT